jgi:hypothetical protein
MKKTTISISELAHRVLMEQKLNKWAAGMQQEMKLIREITRKVKKSLKESGGMQALAQASQELEDAGKDAEDEKVQAALLLAALKKDGDFTKVDPEDVEQEMATIVKEFKSKPSQLNEAEGILGAAKLASLVLGNSALINAISKGVEKATGKKMETSKLAAGINKFAGWAKTITGFFAKVVEKFVGWLAKKLGASEQGAKIAGFSMVLLITLALGAVSITMFPAAGVSTMGYVLSITSLVGKVFEVAELGKHIWDEIKKVPDIQTTGGAPATA